MINPKRGPQVIMAIPLSAFNAEAAIADGTQLTVPGVDPLFAHANGAFRLPSGAKYVSVAGSAYISSNGTTTAFRTAITRLTDALISSIDTQIAVVVYYDGNNDGYIRLIDQATSAIIATSNIISDDTTMEEVIASLLFYSDGN